MRANRPFLERLWYGRRLVLGRCGRLTPLLAAIAGVLVTVTLPSAGAAENPRVDRDRSDLGSPSHAVDRRADRALLELYALEASLATARAERERLRGQSVRLSRAEAALARRVAIVRRSLELSHDRVATTLRRLYVDGAADPIAVILGARSLDEAILGIDSLERAAEQTRRLARELEAGLGRVHRLEESLAEQRRFLETARRRAEAAVEELERRVSARGSYVAWLRRRGALLRARVPELERGARAALRASVELVEAESPTAAPDASPVTTVGPGTLTVDAVAYHLPGRTASGLPVGRGVVAVDPAVIRLGTRLFVPGYGRAVAADVGSAIKGTVIDLWFPTREQALEWGRRTVTITIYR
jgi:3D (Asp-Asp-Asp) domain-containing protein/septal ring factor EnvC (AmiA/AmiB activator)